MNHNFVTFLFGYQTKFSEFANWFYLGKVPFRSNIALIKYYGKDPMPGIALGQAINMEDITFKDNSWFTGWTSVNEEVLRGNISVTATGASDASPNELLQHAKIVMSQEEYVLSYRFEVEAVNTGILIRISELF